MSAGFRVKTERGYERRGRPTIPLRSAGGDGPDPLPAIAPPTELTATGLELGLILNWPDVVAPAGNLAGYAYRLGQTNPPSGSWVETGSTVSERTLSGMSVQDYYVQIAAVNTDGVRGDPSPVFGPFRPLPSSSSGVVRLAHLHPGTSTSPFNIGVALDAQWESATGPVTTDLKKRTGSDANEGVYANQKSSSHPINYASSSDPLRNVLNSKENNRKVGEARVPNQIVISDEFKTSYADRHGHVIQPDRRHMADMFGVNQPSGSDIVVRRYANVDLLGDLLGPQNGTRAFGGSSAAGLIRSAEVQRCIDFRDALAAGTARREDARGLIPHALAWAIRGPELFGDYALWDQLGKPYGYWASGTYSSGDLYLPPGWNVGTPRAGFMKQPGFIWPATEQDWAGMSAGTSAADKYAGAVPMGTFFGIPPWVNVAADLSLDWAGLVIAYAMQDWGGYITVRSGLMTCYIEDQAPTALRSALVAPSFSAYQLRQVRKHFRAITNSTQSTPGGGPIGAARRVALLAAPSLP